MANGTQNQRKRVSDIIKVNDLESWTTDNIIIIKAGTGAGKSYFIKNALYKYARAKGKKILFLVHRSNCTDQFRMEIKAANKTDVIDIMTYQKIEHDVLNKSRHVDFGRYAYVVSDEFHYFVSDANFNNTTDISLKEILNAEDCTKIFMSATSEDVEQYFKTYLSPERQEYIRKYELAPDYSYVNRLTFFYQMEDIETIAEGAIKNDEKMIIFIQSAEQAYKLFKKFSPYSIFNCSRNNNKYYKYVNTAKIATMLRNERFEENLLITTVCLDAGVNIVDKDVKSIVADVKDVGFLIQCLGRKRSTGVDDTVEFYIKVITNQQLSGLRQSMAQDVKMAEYLLAHNTRKYIEKFPRQYDKSNIVYDAVVGDHSDIGTKKVNEMKLVKKRANIEFYTQLMGVKNGYCKYIQKYLNIKDGNVRILIKDHSLIAFLESYVNENKVMLNKSDRTPLIDKIDVHSGSKGNRHRLKSLNAMNAALEEYKLPYRVVCFETTRTIRAENGEKIKKKYKSAWRVERVA